ARAACSPRLRRSNRGDGNASLLPRGCLAHRARDASRRTHAERLFDDLHRLERAPKGRLGRAEIAHLARLAARDAHARADEVVLGPRPGLARERELDRARAEARDPLVADLVDEAMAGLEGRGPIRVLRQTPPAMAGMMLTTSPSLSSVPSASRKRMSSSPRKMFTLRSTPFSSAMRSLMPGDEDSRASRTSPTVPPWTFTSSLPSVKVRRGGGMRTVTEAMCNS